MKLLTTLSQKVSFVVGLCGVFCIAAMMLITTFDLIMRKIAGRGVTGVFEVSTFMFFVTLYSGLAYCQTRHNHIHVTIVVMKLPGKSKFLVWGLTSLVTTATAVMVAVASFIQAGVVKEQFLRTVILWIPYHPFYIFGGVCMCLLSLCLLLDCAKSFAAAFSKEYAEEVSASWGV